MKFNLRDLFWLITLAAISTGWWLEHRRNADDAPKVTGVVMATNSDDLVEVSLGTDDGVKVGSVLQIHRGKQFLGQLTASKATPDHAVGKLERWVYRGKIQAGDKVTAKVRKWF